MHHQHRYTTAGLAARHPKTGSIHDQQVLLTAVMLRLLPCLQVRTYSVIPFTSSLGLME